MLFILSGGSGAGKNTIINAMLSKNDNIDIFTSITTREKRPNEVQGNPYFYLTKEELIEKQNNGKIIEVELIHGNYYGTSYEVLEDKLKQYKILMKDIGVEGTFNLLERIKDITKIIPIYLKVPKFELYKRTRKRGETKESAKRRLSRLAYENSFINRYEYVFNYLPLNTSIECIEALIKYNSGKENVYSVKNPRLINFRKVKRYEKYIEIGKGLPTVKCCVNNNRIVIIKNLECIIASQNKNAFVQKEFINCKCKYKSYKTDIKL